MDSFPHIVGVASAFPSEFVPQSSITDAVTEKWRDSGVKMAVVEKFHRSSMVQSRHVAVPIEKYRSGMSFGERNDAFISTGLEITEKAVNHLFEREQVAPSDIGLIISTTVTGLAVPTIEARLMNRIAFSPSTKRLPLFGLGCVAGAAGIARAGDYLKGHPDQLVLLLSLELCSLSFQGEDVSVANMVSSGLFGDGCAAALLAGAERAKTLKPGPAIVDSCSFFFPDSERVMGFDITDLGFKIVLSGDVPQIAQEKLPPCIDQLLERHHLHRNDIAAWIAHPGGPRVLEALIKGLKIAPNALELSYESLAEVGNLSSASVLLVLEKTLARKTFQSGNYAVLLAMGPAFCAEAVLLRW